MGVVMKVPASMELGDDDVLRRRTDPFDRPTSEPSHNGLVHNKTINNKPASLFERESETCRCCSLSPKTKAYKNVLGTGISVLLVFSSIVALSSLQSSLNDEEGLGLATLVIGSVTFFFSGLLASSVIRLLGTKFTIVLSYVMSLTFIAANFYPRWYTLVPTIILHSVCQGPLWTAVNVHVTTIAIKYAPDIGETSNYLIALFTGITTMFFRLSFIPGNLATSVILLSERGSAGREIIDTSLGSVCNNTEVDNLNPTYIYILMSSFVLMAIAAIVIAVFSVDHLGSEAKFHSLSKAVKVYIRDPLFATFKMFADWKTYLLIPMMVTTAFTATSAIAKMSKVYVSDCIGVPWVGLFSLSFGVFSAISAMATGRLVKCVPQFILVYSSSAILIGTMLFLQFWELMPSYLFAFLPIIVIGSCDGVWHTVPPTLVGIIYPHKKEPAFSVLRMALALGRMIGYTIALFFDISVTLWVGVAIVLTAAVAYSILVFTTQNKNQLFPCLVQKNKELPEAAMVESQKVTSDESKV